jgi:hypothetical protein
MTRAPGEGLSTEVQAGGKIQAGPAKQSLAAVSAGGALRLAPRPPYLAGREERLAGLAARLARR